VYVEQIMTERHTEERKTDERDHSDPSHDASAGIMVQGGPVFQVIIKQHNLNLPELGPTGSLKVMAGDGNVSQGKWLSSQMDSDC
jgi:hypothetical protein